MAIGDLDNDGDQDFVVSHQLAHSAVISNETMPQNNSVTIRFVGTNSNRSGINVRAIAEWPDKKVVREVVGGGSYQASSDHRLHFGIGQETSIPQLSIYWPSGKVDRYTNIILGPHVAIEGQDLLRDK